MMIQVKTFDALSTNELYNILRLRSEVFVVEQACAYQDLDGKDQKAIHILGIKDEELVAYTRIFKPGDYFKEASIGRVVVAANKRDYGYGKEIMRASIKTIEDTLKETTICVSAQTYLKKFYSDLGFSVTGAPYLEDGIPHVKMLRKK